MIHRRIEMITIILVIITISWSWPWEKTRAIELVKADENVIINEMITLAAEKITKIKGWGAQDSGDNILLISFEFSTNHGDYGWFYEVKLIPGLKESTGKVGVYKTVVGDKILMDKYNIVKSDNYIEDSELLLSAKDVAHDWQWLVKMSQRGVRLTQFSYIEKLNALGRKIK